jgi:hypothetical protein
MKHIEKTLKRNENLWKKIFSCLIFPFLTIVFLRLVIFFVQRCSLLFIVFSMCFHCVFCFFPEMFITFHCFFNVFIVFSRYVRYLSFFQFFFLNIRLFIFTFFMYVHYFHCLFNVFSFVQLNVVHFVFFSVVFISFHCFFNGFHCFFSDFHYGSLFFLCCFIVFLFLFCCVFSWLNRISMIGPIKLYVYNQAMSLN